MLTKKSKTTTLCMLKISELLKLLGAKKVNNGQWSYRDWMIYPKRKIVKHKIQHEFKIDISTFLNHLIKSSTTEPSLSNIGYIDVVEISKELIQCLKEI